MKIFRKVVGILCLVLPLIFVGALFKGNSELRAYLPLIPPLWLAVVAMLVEKVSLRVLFICLCCVCSTLVFANYWYGKHKPEEFRTVVTGSIATDYYVPDPVRGYWSRPNVSVKAHAECGGEEVYDVTYSTDARGRRVSFPSIDAREAVIIFGDSYARGEGLNDNQTWAWLLGEASHGRYQVFNYSFHGYGPHQTLALLEHGLDEDLSKYKKLTFIYNLIGSHVRRSAGLGRWDAEGPHYVLEDGKLYRGGTFKDRTQEEFDAVDTGTSNHFLADLLRQSPLWVRVHDAYADRFGYRAKLLTSILAHSFEIIKAKWPGSRMIVVAWPGSDGLALPLTKEGVVVAKVEPWLPNYSENEYHYRYQCDRHPNPKAAALVADGLLRLLDNN